MKRFFGLLICSVFLIAVMLSMAACNANDNTSDKFDNLQLQLNQQKEQLESHDELLNRQKEQLESQDELLNRQKEQLESQDELLNRLEDALAVLNKKNGELEDELAGLKEKNQMLEETVNEFTDAIPHEVGIVGLMSDSFLETLTRQPKILRSKAELTTYLSELDDKYEQYKADLPFQITGKWSMRSKGGRIENDSIFNGDDIAELYNENFFNTKALVFCYFSSSNRFARLVGTNLYLNGAALSVKINYVMSTSTAIDYAMVVLEVDNTYVDNISEVNVKINRLS